MYHTPEFPPFVYLVSTVSLTVQDVSRHLLALDSLLHDTRIPNPPTVRTTLWWLPDTNLLLNLYNTYPCSPWMIPPLDIRES